MIQHRNIIKYYGYSWKYDLKTEYYLMISEFAGINLTKYLSQSKSPLSDRLIIHIAKCVAKGMDHIHSFNIAHRDLKPDNIFLLLPSSFHHHHHHNLINNINNNNNNNNVNLNNNRNNDNNYNINNNLKNNDNNLNNFNNNFNNDNNNINNNNFNNENIINNNSNNFNNNFNNLNNNFNDNNLNNNNNNNKREEGGEREEEEREEEEMVVKIGDFGIACVTREKGAANQTMTCGTFSYMSPEILENSSVSSDLLLLKSDVFSYGYLLYELSTRFPPYFNRSIGEVALIVLQKRGRNEIPLEIPENIPGGVNGKLSEVLKRCWAWDPLLRPSFSDILLALSDIEIDFS